MNASTYQFKVGDFDCAAVADGTFSYAPPLIPPPAEFLFVNPSREQLVQALAEHGLSLDGWGEYTTPFTCLLVSTVSSRVLIDTGAGRLGPNTGNLLKNLASLGVDPGQIDLVILTHGHLDHVGGNADADGRVLFPKAGWVMPKAEWEFWMEGQAEAIVTEPGDDVLLGSIQRNLMAIRDRLDLVVGEKEVLPGIRMLPAPGHTPGHSVAAISSGGEELLYLADLLVHPIHFEEPEWFAAVDMLPDQLAKTRRALLARAAKEESLLMMFHFPFPGLGRALSKGGGWQWKPQI